MLTGETSRAKSLMTTLPKNVTLDHCKGVYSHNQNGPINTQGHVNQTADSSTNGFLLALKQAPRKAYHLSNFCVFKRRVFYLPKMHYVLYSKKRGIQGLNH